MRFLTLAIRFIVTRMPIRQVQRSVLAVYGGPTVLGLFGALAAYKAFKQKSVGLEKKRADEYFPVQSSSERAADHPIVGVS